MAARFLGQYEVPVDDKGRIFLPAELRRSIEPEADDTIVVTRGLDGCLTGHPRNLWAQTVDRMLQLPWKDQKVRRYIRGILSQAAEVRLDRQGRASLPRKLLALTGIGDRLVVTGSGAHLEFWEPETWQAYQSESESGATMEEVAETLDI